MDAPKTVADYLARKERRIVSIGADATVFSALEELVAHDIGALLVLEDGRDLVGLFTERDYSRKVTLQGRDSRSTLVREIMQDRLHPVAPSESIRACMVLMTEKRVRYLPVQDGDRLIGVISIGDVVKSIIGEQDFVIDQLHKYITS